jgi:dTDP-4-amino-4,6-dideoxygalactose transaminase
VIPPLDLLAATEELREDLEAVFSRFLTSGRYVLGPEVNAFESEYANYCRADFCVGVGSGLDALHLSLKTADVGPGDEVIVASNTYIATWLAVTHAGGIVVPVEPDLSTHNIDPAQISERISGNTKAILATNLYGLPVDYDAIRTIADHADLAFLVDNAQAHGAKYKHHVVGGIADLECHSFYPSKNLGALGEGGAVTTSNSEFADRIRLLRNYGSRERYHHEVPGYNSRLDELQAGILRVKLRRLDQWNDRRRAIASVYEERFSQHPDIVQAFEPDWASSAWHLYVVCVPERDQVMRSMAEAGIGCLIHYPIPPHRSAAYQATRFSQSFPIADSLADSVLSLPMGPHLAEKDAENVADTLIQAVEDARRIPTDKTKPRAA